MISDILEYKTVLKMIIMHVWISVWLDRRSVLSEVLGYNALLNSIIVEVWMSM